EKETLAKDDLERILGTVRKRPPHNTFGGFGKRTPSDRPPIEIPTSLTKSSSSNGHAQPGVTPGVEAPEPAGQPAQQPGAFGPGS
ncbi:MAG: ATP-dependent zinc metalloprotease FtsH, partial [Jatrophihabitantaceae bacterium]